LKSWPMRRLCRYMLPPAYVDTATRDVALQLNRAGTRLALLLNRALAAAREPGR